MAAVRISRRVMLVEFARGLGCLVLAYDVRPMSGGKFISSIAYRAISVTKSNPRNNNTCYGTPEDTVQKANESAVENALRKLKSDFGADVDDTNYHEKFVLQSELSDLEMKLEAAKEAIAALGGTVEHLKAGWRHTINKVKELSGVLEDDGSEASGSAIREGGAMGNWISLAEQMAHRMKAVHASSLHALEEARK